MTLYSEQILLIFILLFKCDLNKVTNKIIVKLLNASFNYLNGTYRIKIAVPDRGSVHDVPVTVTSHESNECTFHSKLSQNVAKFMLIAKRVSQCFSGTISHVITIFICKNHYISRRKAMIVKKKYGYPRNKPWRPIGL
jgi:hypothetical protein